MKYLVIAGPSKEAHSHLDDLDLNFEEISLKAFDYYDELEKKKKLEHYVRMDGPPGSVLIFNVKSEEEFAELRGNDPLVQLIGDNVKIIPLADPKHARNFMLKKQKEKKAKKEKKNK